MPTATIGTRIGMKTLVFSLYIHARAMRFSTTLPRFRRRGGRRAELYFDTGLRRMMILRRRERRARQAAQFFTRQPRFAFGNPLEIILMAMLACRPHKDISLTTAFSGPRLLWH